MNIRAVHEHNLGRGKRSWFVSRDRHAPIYSNRFNRRATRRGNRPRREGELWFEKKAKRPSRQSSRRQSPWRASSATSRMLQKVSRLHPFEIGALGDREALEIAAQAVEAELDGAEAHPVATAVNARAAGFHTFLGGDREIDAAAEIDAVGTVVDLDQYRQGVTCAGLLAGCAGHRLGRLAAQFA